MRGIAVHLHDVVGWEGLEQPHKIVSKDSVMGIFGSGTTMAVPGQQAGFTLHALGEQLYLLKPKEPTDRAIISAHGGHRLLSNTNTFNVPQGTNLHFYSDDTFSMLDPGFANFYLGTPDPKETITGQGKCFDYVLTKYQGGHNKVGETYDSIARVVDRENASMQRAERDLFSAGVSMNHVAKARIQNAKAGIRLAAVITVRNRRFTSSMTLSRLLKAVTAAAPEITTFDCSFCRSTMFGGSQAVTFV